MPPSLRRVFQNPASLFFTLQVVTLLLKNYIKLASNDNLSVHMPKF